MFILDTDHVSLLQWDDSAEAQRLDARLETVPEQELATTVITYEEQMRGWLAYVAKARTVAQEIEAYRRLLKSLEDFRNSRVMAFDERAAAEYQRLKRSRVRLGAMDLKIAAIVLTHDATLLSRNLRDFRQIDGLKVEDWTAPPEPGEEE
jgi:tRNA(fMet)-specific endonuclease VapC